MTAKSLNNKAGLRVAFFAGTFDPFTIGHASIVERALAIFDKIIIGVGINAKKVSAVETDRHSNDIINLYKDEPRIKVVTYDGLTTDAATDAGACCLLRGVRSVKDFEYERDLADMNRRISGLETMLIYSLPEYAAISSSVVRELKALGKDITMFLPAK